MPDRLKPGLRTSDRDRVRARAFYLVDLLAGLARKPVIAVPTMRNFFGPFPAAMAPLPESRVEGLCIRTPSGQSERWM